MGKSKPAVVDSRMLGWLVLVVGVTLCVVGYLVEFGLDPTKIVEKFAISVGITLVGTAIVVLVFDALESRRSELSAIAALVRRFGARDQSIAASAALELRASGLLGGGTLNNGTFSGASLDGVDLSGMVAREANLIGVTMRNANLHAADLTGSRLNFSTLRRVDLENAVLDGAAFNGADLSYADLGGAALRGATLVGATLTDCDARGADFTGADLSAVDLTTVRMGGAKIGQCTLDSFTKLPTGAPQPIKEGSTMSWSPGTVWPDGAVA